MQKNKFNIGDEIAVVDDTITGVIVSVNKNIVQIKDEDGFLYFYNSNEIVFTNKNIYENIRITNKDKQRSVSIKQITKNKTERVLEVDLHIHQITHSNRYMSNADMLQKQISTAKTKINFAIKNNFPKIIFIHGKGEGVLKKELLHLLKNYPVEINDASYKKYGQGAMEVLIYKSKL